MKGSSLEAAVLADIALVLLIGVALTPVRARLRQPAVVAEIAAGLLLGLSVLGLLPGDLPGLLFPEEARSHLSVIAQVGIALFMFAAGWELDFQALRGRGRSVLAVTTASLVVPFALAVGLALALLAVRPAHTGSAPSSPSPLLFAPFLGIVLSVSALSVLIRIIGENRLAATPVGTMATACGAITEVVAWCAVVTLITAAQGLGTGDLVLTLARIAAYALVMTLAVRPALRVLPLGGLSGLSGLSGLGPLGGPGSRHRPHGGRPWLLILAVGSGVFLSAWCTTRLGVHAVIGAFAFGLAMPRDVDPGLRHAVEDPLRTTGALLVPVFFALTGLTVDVTELGLHGLLALVAFLAVAWGGKFAGAALTARLLHLPWRDAATLGALANTKGLSEIIMLTLGRDAGLIDGHLFTALLLTALTATALVNPVVRHLTDTTARSGPEGAVPAQRYGTPRAVLEASDDHGAWRPLDDEPGAGR
ncbi:cation:proton antiporter [Streptomyces sp. UNOC14_S4]|uniref:cation:proton antiporter n=1 Tax=Streptomyces sp. UNOC14_S4 TaxID=2872340 RepID=UPI001E4FE802|nr:cation:proton antiporter [Streptomyces sp. UNOC14_S4]MCC3771339.1 cation:proton antiporter [Streptomyces sp. UNOC14_S4]